MAESKPTSYEIIKTVTTDVEVSIDLQDVLGFIGQCDESEKYAIELKLDIEPEVPDDPFRHLSTEARDLLEVCGKTLDEDEKLIYFLTNIEDISLEQLKEAISGQQV